MIDCSSWLAQRNILESHCGQPLADGTYYRRFAKANGAAAADVFSSIARQPDTTQATKFILQFTDWSCFGNIPIPDTLRPLRDASFKQTTALDLLGLAMSMQEFALLSACCTYIIDEGLSAYVYASNPSLTAYLWEGEFLEIWSADAAAVELATQSLRRSGVDFVIQMDDSR
ncbi:MAG: hypothetical protein V4805_18470 [Pseudomonadota bacterium]